MPTAPAGLRASKKRATRQRLIEVAWALFTERGYDATTVAEIADRAGISARSFFHYFAAKDALLHPGLDEFLDRLAVEVAGRPPGEPLLDSLLAGLDAADDGTGEPAEVRAARHAVIEQSAAATASTYLPERVGAAVADMARARLAHHVDLDARAHLAGALGSAVITLATQQWLAAGPDADLAALARHFLALASDLFSERPGERPVQRAAGRAPGPAGVRSTSGAPRRAGS